MNNKMKRPLLEGISVCFSILFLYSGVSKYMDYDVFSEQMALIPLLAPIREGVAVLLPAMEIGVAVALFFSGARLIALYFTFSMMLAFTGFVIYLLNDNEHLHLLCTCGGLLDQLSWPAHLVLNSVLLLLSGFSIVIQRLLRQEKKISNTNLRTI